MYVLGIHPDGDYFKVALLSKVGRKIKINMLQEFKKDILDLNQLKKKITKETNYHEEKVDVVSALSVEELFVRHFELPIKHKSGVMKALPFQMESILPFDKEYVTTIPKVKKGGKGSRVTLYSFLEETLQNHVSTIKTLGFDPDWVSSVAFGLYRFVKLFGNNASSCLIFHFGWERSYLVSIKEEEIEESLMIEGGLKTFIDAVQLDHPGLQEIDFSFLKEELIKNEILPEKKSHGGAFLAYFRQKLYRAFSFLQEKGKFVTPEGIVFTGYGDIFDSLVLAMEEFPLNPIPLLPHLEYERQELASYAIEIGIALDCFEKDQKTVQFRVMQFAAKKQIKKAKKKLETLLGLSLVGSGLFFCALGSFFVKKHQILKEQFNQIALFGGEKTTAYPEMQKMCVSAKKSQKEIETLWQKLQKEKMEGIFALEPPPVHLCMDWVMAALPKEIRLVGATYELEKYPHLQKPRQPYLTKLEISFTAESQEHAEGFLQKLCETKEKWIEEKALSKDKDGYQIRIYLKTKAS